MMLSETAYRHDTIPCGVLDVRAHLPPDEQIELVPDAWDVFRIQARRAQIHLEMRMEMLRKEEAIDQEMCR